MIYYKYITFAVKKSKILIQMLFTKIYYYIYNLLLIIFELYLILNEFKILFIFIKKKYTDNYLIL